MEILHTFGIDPVLLVAQVVNFGIIFFILKRFLYKPILAMLRKREGEIKKGIEDAQKAQKLLEETAEKERKVLKTAQIEAKKIIEDAKKHADTVLQESKTQTRKEAENILKEAREQITFETKQAEKRLAGHVTQLAVALLEKSLPGLLSEGERTDVLKKAVKKLKGQVN